MDIYTFALTLGGVGLAAMAATGAAHVGSGPGHGHAGHTGGGGGVSSPSHSGGTHGHVGLIRGRSGGLKASAKGRLLSLLSPRMVFSVLLGFGAAGVLARHLVGGVLLLAISVLGALVFELAIVTPMWNFMFRFASRPAETLDMSTLAEAQATSGFNTNGEGIVLVEVDGQIVQCLGTLRDDDRALGVRVRAGDRLRVEEIDSARQRCTVSYVGHGV